MELKELIKRLKQTTGDAEIDHVRADELLLEFIHDDKVTDAFNKIQKFYS